MQVKVTQRGFLYWVRQPGELMDIAEHLFSPEWMEVVDSEKAPAPPADDAHVAEGSSLFSDPTKVKQKVPAVTTLDVK